MTNDNDVSNKVARGIMAACCMAVIGLLAARISTVSNADASSEVAAAAPIAAETSIQSQSTPTSQVATIPNSAPVVSLAAVASPPSPTPEATTTPVTTTAPPLPTPPLPTPPPPTNPPEQVTTQADGIAAQIIATNKVCPTMSRIDVIENIAGGKFGSETDNTDTNATGSTGCEFHQAASTTAYPWAQFYFLRNETVAGFEARYSEYKFQDSSVNSAIKIGTKSPTMTEKHYYVSIFYETPSGLFLVDVGVGGDVFKNIDVSVRALQDWLAV
jgi:hypothetical protein